MGTGRQKPDWLSPEAAALAQKTWDRDVSLRFGRPKSFVLCGENPDLRLDIYGYPIYPERTVQDLPYEQQPRGFQIHFREEADLGVMAHLLLEQLGMSEANNIDVNGYVHSSLTKIFDEACGRIRQQANRIEQTEQRLAVAALEKQELLEQTRLLAEQLRLASQDKFGTSSEQSSQVMPEEIAHSIDADPVPEPQSKKLRAVSNAGRKPLPEHLPRVNVECDLSAAAKKCEHCDREMQFVGEESTERLELIPAKLVVTRFIAKKYVCRCCKKFVVSLVPKSVIPGSSFGSPTVLADMVVNKYQFALPLYRLTLMYDRAGMPISRTTMANLMIGVADRLTPLYERFRETLLRQDVIHADETTLQVLKEPGRAPQSQSYMWQYCSSTHATQQLAMFEYQPTRAGAHALKFLTKPDGEVFNGYLQVDGYAGYNTIQAAARVGCMAHVRRKFVEALQSVPAAHAQDSIALRPIGLIQQLYVIEVQLKTASVAERTRVRQAQSVPILDQFKDWLDEHKKLVIPKSLMGKAIHYALGQWPYVVRFVDNGLLSIDNNIAERSIKNLVIGRKNWLFSTSVDGAYATAVLTTMVRSALANKLDPYQYLVQVLKKLPYAESEEDFQELMPWCVRAQLDEAATDRRMVA